jgi:hypothetical protein
VVGSGSGIHGGCGKRDDESFLQDELRNSMFWKIM